jgi:hypothetical protein
MAADIGKIVRRMMCFWFESPGAPVRVEFKLRFSAQPFRANLVR